MADCKACSVELTDNNLREVVDDKGKIRFICKRCKKLSNDVIDIFGSLEWPAFVKFVTKRIESDKDYKMPGPTKKEDDNNPSTKK